MATIYTTNECFEVKETLKEVYNLLLKKHFLQLTQICYYNEGLKVETEVKEIIVNIIHFIKVEP